MNKEDTSRRILKIADLLNPIPEKPKKSNVELHHSFNEVLRQLRAEQPKEKAKRKPKKKIQSSNKSTKGLQSNNKNKFQRVYLHRRPEGRKTL